MLKSVITYTFLAYITYTVVVLIKDLDLDKIIYKHYPGPCTTIKSLAKGSEDMERIPGDKVLVTTGFRFISQRKQTCEDCVGKVFLIDLNQPHDDPKLVKINNYPGNILDVDFHGMSSWVDNKTGEIFVFIVNHLMNQSVVEIFKYDDQENSLHHIRTCQDEIFHVLNDIVAVSKETFYVTNYKYWRGPIKAQIELLLKLKWGSVVFYDGKKARIVQDSLCLPNGINKSPDDRYIYVAVTHFREILVYHQNTDRTFTLVQKWPTYSLPDNIVVDENGDIWLGAHTVMYKIIRYIEDPKAISPSQVLRLKVKEGLITDMTEVFADDGTLISGSSVALYAKNKLFIGSVFTQTIVCDVQYI